MFNLTNFKDRLHVHFNHLNTFFEFELEWGSFAFKLNKHLLVFSKNHPNSLLNPVHS